MFRTATGAILIFTLNVFNVASSNYSHDELTKRFPDYGRKWIYMPDENEVPTKVYLNPPSKQDVLLFASSRKNKESISFTLCSRALPNCKTFTLRNLSDVGTYLDTKKDTKCVIHGWLSSGRSHTCISIKDAYLDEKDVNLVIVDWSKIADNLLYLTAAANTKDIGRFFALFLNHIIDLGVSPKKIHLIGHSLGAHISGFAGRFVTKGKVGRITGLDPALPGFSHRDHLLSSDAEFVDVIHTCGGVLGFYQSLGHADFFPNGGYPPQNGCGGLAEFVEGCSHGRSWKYFAESINGKNKFLAYKAASWEEFLKKSDKREVVPMGDPAESTAKGSYYLSTQSSSPFASVGSVHKH